MNPIDTYCSPRSRLSENWIGLCFLFVFFLMAAGSASYVGYMIKRADSETARALDEGMARAHAATTRTAEQDVLLNVYEFNRTVRVRGLPSALAGMTEQERTHAIDGLRRIGAERVALTVEQVAAGVPWTTPGNAVRVSPDALRTSKKYDRSTRRSVDRSLYQFITKGP